MAAKIISELLKSLKLTLKHNCTQHCIWLMAGEAVNLRFSAPSQVGFGQTGKLFENRHKPYV